MAAAPSDRRPGVGGPPPGHSSPYNTRLQSKIQATQRQEAQASQRPGTPVAASTADAIDSLTFWPPPSGATSPTLDGGGLGGLTGRDTPEISQITPGESPSVSPHFHGAPPLSFAAVVAGGHRPLGLGGSVPPHVPLLLPAISARGIRSAFRSNLAAARCAAATHSDRHSQQLPPPLYPRVPQRENAPPVGSCARPPSLPLRGNAFTKSTGDLFGNIMHDTRRADFDKERQQRYYQAGRSRWRNDAIL